MNSFKHTPRQIPSYKTHLTHRTRRPSCGCGIRPGPCLSSSPRTTILCPRLPSAPPPPAGRCPAASSQPQGRRPSAGRSAVSPDPVGLNYCSSSIFPPFPKCCWPTQPRYEPALPGCRRLPAHFSSSFLQISKGGRGVGDSCCIYCLCYKCCYLRYLPSTYAFCNFM